MVLSENNKVANNLEKSNKNKMIENNELINE
jgi:hypothetical protein